MARVTPAIRAALADPNYVGIVLKLYPPDKPPRFEVFAFMVPAESFETKAPDLHDHLMNVLARAYEFKPDDFEDGLQGLADMLAIASANYLHFVKAKPTGYYEVSVVADEEESGDVNALFSYRRMTLDRFTKEAVDWM